MTAVSRLVSAIAAMVVLSIRSVGWAEELPLTENVPISEVQNRVQDAIPDLSVICINLSLGLLWRVSGQTGPSALFSWGLGFGL